MAALKEAEEDLAKRERGNGVNAERLSRANDETLASLRLLEPTLAAVPGVDEAMMMKALPEAQRGVLSQFWKMREEHYMATVEYGHAKKMVEVLKAEALGRSEKIPVGGPKGEKSRKNLDAKTAGAS